MSNGENHLPRKLAAGEKVTNQMCVAIYHMGECRCIPGAFSAPSIASTGDLAYSNFGLSAQCPKRAEILYVETKTARLARGVCR